MKLPGPWGCQFPLGQGKGVLVENTQELTMIVEERGIPVWTRVRLPPGPL